MIPHRSRPSLTSILTAALAFSVTPQLSIGAPQGERVVFIRGAAGTGGFLGGGSDEQLSDIGNFSTNGGNHGFGQLAELLRNEGYAVEQVIESTTGPPVDFAALDLSSVGVLVLGSNNQSYPAADVQRVTDFVFNGGGLLVISDANWGSNWGAAPSSDQPFLDPYGLVMNQDTGTYQSREDQGDHLVPVDPILSGPDLGFSTGDDVLAFDGEGVSPLTVGTPPADVRVQILARAEGNIRVNDAPGSGSMRAAGPQDASLVVAYRGAGAVVGHFDRNTFFNTNGAGTNITRFDNAQLARNLFRFLSGPVPQPYGQAKVNSQGGVARIAATRVGPEIFLSSYGGIPGVTTLFGVGTERGSQPLFGGQLLIGGDIFRFGLGLSDPDGRYTQRLTPMPRPIAFKLTFQQFYRDTVDPTGFGLSDAVEVPFLP